MSVVEWLAELGGVATWGTLVRVTSRADVERATRAGDIVQVARGRYVLPSVAAGPRAAHRAGGVLSYASAALHWGWEVKQAPRRIHVTVPRWRPRDRGSDVQIHRANLKPTDVDGLATSQEVTLLHCLRTLPFDEALAIADSALRHGFGQMALERIADGARGPGARQVRRVAAEASELPANPFESVLRAIALDISGLSVRPQVTITVPGMTARSDLVDERLRVVLEADSFEWHGGRQRLAEDSRRYNRLVVGGWIVLRFAWEDVMHDPDYVRTVLTGVVALAETLNKGRCGCQCAA